MAVAVVAAVAVNFKMGKVHSQKITIHHLVTAKWTHWDYKTAVANAMSLGKGTLRVLYNSLHLPLTETCLVNSTCATWWMKLNSTKLSGLLRASILRRLRQERLCCEPSVYM